MWSKRKVAFWIGSVVVFVVVAQLARPWVPENVALSLGVAAMLLVQGPAIADGEPIPMAPRLLGALAGFALSLALAELFDALLSN